LPSLSSSANIGSIYTYKDRTALHHRGSKLVSVDSQFFYCNIFFEFP